MEKQFNIDIPNPHTNYYCSPNIKSHGFTTIHKKVLTQTLRSSDIINVNAPTANGWTPLMLAVRNVSTVSSLETVQMLFAAGADVNQQNNDGWTALMMAARYSTTDSSLETVQMLLAAGADVNKLDIDGWTALMLAARYSTTDSSLETVQVLLAAGSDVNLQNNDGWTALMMAAKYPATESSLETVQVLLAAGAILKKNHVKTVRSYPEMCKCLLTAGIAPAIIYPKLKNMFPIIQETAVRQYIRKWYTHQVVPRIFIHSARVKLQDEEFIGQLVECKHKNTHVSKKLQETARKKLGVHSLSLQDIDAILNQ